MVTVFVCSFVEEEDQETVSGSGRAGSIVSHRIRCTTQGHCEGFWKCGKLVSPIKVSGIRYARCRYGARRNSSST